MFRRPLLLSTVVAMVLLSAAPALAVVDPIQEGANLNLPEAPCDQGKAEPSDPASSNDPIRPKSAPEDLPKIDDPGGFTFITAGCFTPLPDEVMNHNIR